MAHRAAAAVALDAGDPAEAATKALTSAALADQVGAPVWAAAARTLAGRALAQLGERDRAVAELETAAAELQRCGAVRYRDAAERELPASGSTSTGARARGRQTGPASNRSPSASSRSRDWSSIAGPIAKSPLSSISAKRRSRRTCATSSAKSTPTPVSTLPGSSSRPIVLPRPKPECALFAGASAAPAVARGAPAGARPGSSATGASLMSNRPDAATLEGMPQYLLSHKHHPSECGVVFACFKGHSSPLRHQRRYRRASSAATRSGGSSTRRPLTTRSRFCLLCRPASTAVEVREVQIP